MADYLRGVFSLLNFVIYGVYQEKYFITLERLTEILDSEFGGLRKKHSGLCTNLAFCSKKHENFGRLSRVLLRIYIQIYKNDFTASRGRNFYIHSKSHSANTVEESELYLI